jgi:hypothetical protein
MEDLSITPKEKEKILEYFGKKPEDLTPEEFDRKLRELRSKYHPDKYEKFGDETVKDLAAEKFREIELLAEKIRFYLSVKNEKSKATEVVFDRGARFAYDELKIEIITDEKDLKYYLFGTHYRWLERGDRYKIKDTEAYIIIDEDHRGRSVGFREGIKMYLTFNATDSIETIIAWLYERIAGYASALIIGGKSIPVNYDEMVQAVKKKTLLKLGDGN